MNSCGGLAIKAQLLTKLLIVDQAYLTLYFENFQHTSEIERVLQNFEKIFSFSSRIMNFEKVCAAEKQFKGLLLDDVKTPNLERTVKILFSIYYRS